MLKRSSCNDIHKLWLPRLMIFICDALARNKQYSLSEDGSATKEGTSPLLERSLTSQRHCNGRTSSQTLLVVLRWTLDRLVRAMKHFVAFPRKF